MSKRHTPEGRAEVDTAKGELRKPTDYSNQPGQSWTEAPPGAPDVGRPTAEEAADIGQSSRESGHGSGDRNPLGRDWNELAGGTQRDATPDAPLDRERRPDRA